ncbi:hypothetical protein H8356DRAFT_1276887 [Neocallimastix lanati (nom. inval.)]|uniref:Uncharacterized protein n=1 Tax=Neocallimastix californiae TaxID=1754190 RepID=A0A1Y1ZSK1_9FUNG|nr:hypothetical protein H8356DRAFT_1285181 [Neocallimastix sp. JGI-2020a]KAG4094684.1 hypothetical protein H8356DRAFT_1276887 [Neocallimastix sp. JGI-2020a]ORY13221.1 hypothetical protein LY90DRAFT_636792 [Neocallimastix californiae]|eukprot:ORY13221.1 hypothetical protein LY90DRAFT_636792 [Neocallimastix californiae]
MKLIKNNIKNNALNRRGFNLDVNGSITSADFENLLNAINEELRPIGYTIGTPDGCEGGTILTVLTNEQVHAFYYHSTKVHTVTAWGKTKSGRVCAEPGEWAHAISMSGKHSGGNKSFCSIENYDKYCQEVKGFKLGRERF